jgi:hypothetical protein
VIIPPSIIAESCKNFCVCYFKDKKFPVDAPPHFYVIVPISDESALLFIVITSQVQKREKYYNNSNPLNKCSLVKVNKSKLSCLSKECIIDCNQPELIGKNELDGRIDPKFGFEIRSRIIPHDIIDAIKKAIKSSTIVKQFIKDLI